MAATNGRTRVPATVLDVLRRADQRWAQKQSDEPAADEYLKHLAQFVQPVVGDTPAPQVDERELTRLREQAAAAEQNAAARRAERDEERAEVEQLRAQVETLQREAVRAVGALESTRRERDQLNEQLTEARATDPRETVVESGKVREQEKLIRQLRADYDALAADNQKMADQLAAARSQRDGVVEHRCTWQWHGPDEPMRPCECGRPVPRYELREVS